MWDHKVFNDIFKKSLRLTIYNSMIVLKSTAPFYGEKNKRSPGQFWYLFIQCDFFYLLEFQLWALL